MNSFFINKLKASEIKAIAHFTGIICIILGLFLLLPVGCAIIYNDSIRYLYSFIASAIISLVPGLILYYSYKDYKKTQLSLKGDLIFVFGIWGVAALLAGLPYYFSGTLGVIDSFFQAMSGITTTGFSFIPASRTPYSLALWQALTQWLGGLGFIIFILVLVPTTGKLNQLYTAEGRTEQMTPNIRHTSIIFIKLYLLISAIGVALYIMVGLDLFDSFCYMMAAIATGGFSIYPDSVGGFSSLPVQIVTIIQMLLGSTNFILIYRLIKGNFKAFYKDSETKTMFALIATATILITLSHLSSHTYGSDVFITLRHALFQVISVMSSTGFTSTDINMWSPFCYHILIIVMFCGGGICSTAGGIKLYNIYLLLKSVWWEGQTIFLPKNSVNVKKVQHDGRNIELSYTEIRPIIMYIIAYLLIFVVSATIILVFCNDIQVAYALSASAIGNIGVGPEYINVGAPAVVKLVMILEFWIGRIGVWPILLVVVYEINKLNSVISKRNSN